MAGASVVHIARHGERIDHVNRAWSETAERPHDPFLTEKGIKQARALGRELKDKRLTHIFASPFYRTVQTANEVAKEVGLTIKIESGLGEFLNRDWFATRPTMIPAEELKKEFDCVDTTYKSQVSCRFPESRDDVIVRAGVAARLLASKYEGTLLFVGHGMSCEFLARGLTNAGVIPYISYCSLMTCTESKSGVEGLYDVEDEVRIDFMGEEIRPLVK